MSHLDEIKKVSNISQKVRDYWELKIKNNITTQPWEEKLCIHVCITWSPCCTVGKKIQNNIYSGVVL